MAAHRQSFPHPLRSQRLFPAPLVNGAGSGQAGRSPDVASRSLVVWFRPGLVPLSLSRPEVMIARHCTSLVHLHQVCPSRRPSAYRRLGSDSSLAQPDRHRDNAPSMCQRSRSRSADRRPSMRIDALPRQYPRPLEAFGFESRQVRYSEISCYPPPLVNLSCAH